MLIAHPLRESPSKLATCLSSSVWALNSCSGRPVLE